MSSDQISVNEVSSTTEGDGIVILNDNDSSNSSTCLVHIDKLTLYNNVCAGPVDINGANSETVIAFVIWKGMTISKFSFTLNSQMSTLYEHFSKKFGVDYSQLVFKYKHISIQPAHFFGQINFIKTDFIVGGFKSDVVIYDENEIDNFMFLFMYIRFQFEHITMPYVVRVEKSEPLVYSMKIYAEHINVPFDRLRFSLNGFLLNGSASPIRLRMEDGEKIHVSHVCTDY